MAKSIESIWKEGFLDDQALVAPRVNDLYNKKSQHIVTKFRRAFKLNLLFIMGSSVVAFVGYAISGAFYVGLSAFLLLNWLVITSYREAKKLQQIDQGTSSYEYLKTFDQQLKQVIASYTRMYRFIYPVFFLLMVAGTWFSSFSARELERLTAKFPALFYSINGVPIYPLTFVIIVTLVLTYFGKRIYMFDVKLMYGRVLCKLEKLLQDMEELRQ
ncbi:hypothetical protein [Microscilla marina]|uniref:Uncharacterized protein n=1 Tax=Microscilla marina ATCC 23134 TaxID=313606 RepID=A1ZCN7_MICM2|nr:hypothetical protein [Microscilla marina]EAY32039.1 hypothetical protein M23134_02068 [Microscilla marina ATCC 23134]